MLCYEDGCQDGRFYAAEVIDGTDGVANTCLDENECLGLGFLTHTDPDQQALCVSAAKCAAIGYRHESECVSACPANTFVDVDENECVSGCPGRRFRTAEDGARECVSECSAFYVYEEVVVDGETQLYAHCYAGGCPEGAPYFAGAAEASGAGLIDESVKNGENRKNGEPPRSSCVSEAQCITYALACAECEPLACVSPAACAAAGMLVYGQKCVSECPESAFLDPAETRCIDACPKYAEVEDASSSS